MYLFNIIKFINIKSILSLLFFIFIMPINGLFILIKLLINKFIYPTPKQFQSNFRTVLINSGNTNIVLCLTRILGISGYTIVICDKNKYCISKYSKYCSAFIKIDDYKDNKNIKI